MVCRALDSCGHSAERFRSLWEMLTALEDESPSMVIADTAHVDGRELRRLCEVCGGRGIEVILITCRWRKGMRKMPESMVQAITLTKPFGVTELAHAVKRATEARLARISRMVVRGGISLDCERTRAEVEGRTVALTGKECSLLHVLMTGAEEVQSRERLFRRAWKCEYLGQSRTVDAHIASLRRKLGAAGEKILTVRGVGYCFKEI